MKHLKSQKVINQSSGFRWDILLSSDKTIKHMRTFLTLSRKLVTFDVRIQRLRFLFCLTLSCIFISSYHSTAWKTSICLKFTRKGNWQVPHFQKTLEANGRNLVFHIFLLFFFQQKNLFEGHPDDSKKKWILL